MQWFEYEAFFPLSHSHVFFFGCVCMNNHGGNGDLTSSFFFFLFFLNTKYFFNTHTGRGYKGFFKETYSGVYPKIPKMDICP